MAIPILNQNGAFAITIDLVEEQIHRACNGFTLEERPGLPDNQKYLIRWFDLHLNQSVTYTACSYTIAIPNRRFALVNEVGFSFVLSRVISKQLS